MNGESLFFTLFALSACLGAVAVVVSQSIVRMAFWLVISLGSTAGLFFLANADFVGATQLLIYVGGTLVLLVFAVMLTDSSPYSRIDASSGEIVVAGLIGLTFLFMVVASVRGVDWEGSQQRIAAATGTEEPPAAFDDDSEGDTLRPIGMLLLGLRPGSATTTDIGSGYTAYLLPFEIVSIHLLVVLIGAAYLARAKRRRDA